MAYIWASAKSVDEPLYFIDTSSPPLNSPFYRYRVPPRRDSVAAPGGEVDLYARVSSHRSVWRTFGLHLSLCKKCRQTPIFTLLVFPPTLRGGTREVPSREQALSVRAAAGWRTAPPTPRGQKSGHRRWPSAERARSEPAVVLVTHAPHGGALVAWVVRVRGWG